MGHGEGIGEWARREERQELERLLDQAIGGMRRASRLTGDDLKRAAKAFGQRTCCPDGMHPRHIALISDEAREALADILNAVEAHGQFPTEAQSLIVALFDKPAGGTRPIGWYRAIFRVWA